MKAGLLRSPGQVFNQRLEGLAAGNVTGHTPKLSVHSCASLPPAGRTLSAPRVVALHKSPSRDSVGGIVVSDWRLSVLSEKSNFFFFCVLGFSGSRNENTQI